LEGEYAEGVGGVGGGDCCEEVGCCWRVEFGGEDCGPPLADGWGVGEELGWLLGCCLYWMNQDVLMRFEWLTLRMYRFVGWNDLGTMVVSEGTSSGVACRTVNGFVGDSIVLEILWCH